MLLHRYRNISEIHLVKKQNEKQYVEYATICVKSGAREYVRICVQISLERWAETSPISYLQGGSLDDLWTRVAEKFCCRDFYSLSFLHLKYIFLVQKVKIIQG